METQRVPVDDVHRSIASACHEKAVMLRIEGEKNRQRVRLTRSHFRAVDSGGQSWPVGLKTSPDFHILLLLRTGGILRRLAGAQQEKQAPETNLGTDGPGQLSNCTMGGFEAQSAVPKKVAAPPKRRIRKPAPRNVMTYESRLQ